MGIDFCVGEDHQACEAHWSYIGFMRFRKDLAREILLDLESFDNFGGERSWEDVDDPITKLLNHSDCDGDISAEDCKVVAPRLRELVAAWDDSDHDKINALKLADGIDLAAKRGVRLEFC